MIRKRPEPTRNQKAPGTRNPYAGPLSHVKSTTYILRPIHLILGAVSCVAATVAVTGAAGYFLLRSDIAPDTSIDPQDITLQYQDRIDRLRAEIERLNSRQMVDREVVEIQVLDVLRRQQDLTQRHTIVTDLVARAESVGIYLNTNKPLPQSKPPLDSLKLAASASDDPTAIGGESEIIDEPVKALGLRDDSGTAFDPLTVLQQPNGDKVSFGLKKNDKKQAALDAIKNNILEMGTESTAAVDAITVATESRIDDILGITAPLLPALRKSVLKNTALGGPFEPLSATGFGERLDRANSALKTLKRLKFAALRLPIKRPVRNASISSSYGPRMDPFLGRLAMHTGTDFKAHYGARVFSTAPGTVIKAGWKGGYGKMVEIRHASGFTTRYAHLSKMKVVEGDHVLAGDIIGNVGSTGRSTGPHLHYEVRRHDKPSNPASFMRAGEKLSQLSL